MIASGLVLLVFVVVHVKQFKFGAYYQTAGSEPSATCTGPRSRCSSSRSGSLFYVDRACSLVGLHLRHGIASGFQSLGLDHPLLHAAADDARHRSWRCSSAAGSAIIPIWVYLTH